MGLFSPIENRLIFRPCTAAQDWQPPPEDIHARDVGLTMADGTTIHGWWCALPGWTPADGAMLYCHGNAGNLSHRAESIRRWQRLLGQAVLIFDYPGYGKSGGRPTEAGCYAAGELMYDFIVNRMQVPAERVILYGGSLGGAIATELACKFPPRVLVLVSAFTSIRDMARCQFPWLPFISWFAATRLDNLSKMASCKAPVFIAHGTADRLVPFAHSERLRQAVQQPSRLFPMEGYDHNHTPGPDFYESLKEFLQSHGV
jgi:uncharacterized protein